MLIFQRLMSMLVFRGIMLSTTGCLIYHIPCQIQYYTDLQKLCLTMIGPIDLFPFLLIPTNPYFLSNTLIV